MKKTLLLGFASLLLLAGCNGGGSSSSSATSSSDTSSPATSIDESKYEGYEHLKSWPGEKIKQDLGTSADLPAYEASDYFYAFGYDQNYDYLVEIIVPNAPTDAASTYAATLTAAGFSAYNVTGYYDYYSDDYEVLFRLKDNDFVMDIYAASSIVETFSWPMDAINEHMGTTGTIPNPGADYYVYEASYFEYDYNGTTLTFPTVFLIFEVEDSAAFLISYTATLEAAGWTVEEAEDEYGPYYDALEANYMYEILFYEYTDGIIAFEIY